MESAPKQFAYEQSRIGVDQCSTDQRSIQNTQASNYNLRNFYLQDCNMRAPIDFATSQPAVNFKGGHLGAGGCNVDENSKLMLGALQTHPKARVDLFERPFMTVPFLGRGAVDTVQEARLQQGERETNRRSVNKLGEKTYMNHSLTPLIDPISEAVQDPKHLVEEVASNGWVRGGLASRDLVRDTK
jgi:hypothetical protein